MRRVAKLFNHIYIGKHLYPMGLNVAQMSERNESIRGNGLTLYPTGVYRNRTGIIMMGSNSIIFSP